MKKVLFSVLALISPLASAAACSNTGKYLFGEISQPAGTKRECGAYLGMMQGMMSKSGITEVEMFKVSTNRAVREKLLPTVLKDMDAHGYTLVHKDITKSPLNITLAFKKSNSARAVAILEVDDQLFLMDARR